MFCQPPVVKLYVYSYRCSRNWISHAISRSLRIVFIYFWISVIDYTIMSMLISKFTVMFYLNSSVIAEE